MFRQDLEGSVLGLRMLRCESFRCNTRDWTGSWLESWIRFSTHLSNLSDVKASPQPF